MQFLRGSVYGRPRLRPTALRLAGFRLRPDECDAEERRVAYLWR